MSSIFFFNQIVEDIKEREVSSIKRYGKFLEYISNPNQSDDANIFIEDIPMFSEENSNQQSRFITLIDIFYEKKIPLLISSNFQLHELCSSSSLSEPFKRTKSRIYELTSPDNYAV